MTIGYFITTGCLVYHLYNARYKKYLTLQLNSTFLLITPENNTSARESMKTGKYYL